MARSPRPAGRRFTSAAAISVGLAAAACCGAHADPVIYDGVVGKLPVVVELTDDPAISAGQIAGRYFYRSEGIDIPLQFVRRDAAVLVLREETACPHGGCAGDPPAGGLWTLSPAPDGLAGSWALRRSHDVTLRRIGGRERGADEAETPLGLYDASSRLGFSETTIAAATNPYEHEKLDVEMTTAETVDRDGASFTLVADRRMPLRYPRIVALPGSASIDAANRLLERRHWAMNLDAFGCMALRYPGFHEDTDFWSSDLGTTAGYDDITVSVSHLDDRVMGWTESGSLWCGGASPANFVTSHIIDVQEGELLAMSDLFAGWTSSGPGEALLRLVNARRGPDHDADLEEDERCGFADLLKSYLGARPVRGDDGSTAVVFGIYGLPTVVNACAGDLVTLPVAEIAEHLTARGASLLR